MERFLSIYFASLSTEYNADGIGVTTPYQSARCSTIRSYMHAMLSTTSFLALVHQVKALLYIPVSISFDSSTYADVHTLYKERVMCASTRFRALMSSTLLYATLLHTNWDAVTLHDFASICLVVYPREFIHLGSTLHNYVLKFFNQTDSIQSKWLYTQIFNHVQNYIEIKPSSNNTDVSTVEVRSIHTEAQHVSEIFSLIPCTHPMYTQVLQLIGNHTSGKHFNLSLPLFICACALLHCVQPVPPIPPLRVRVYFCLFVCICM